MMISNSALPDLVRMSLVCARVFIDHSPMTDSFYLYHIVYPIVITQSTNKNLPVLIEPSSNKRSINIIKPSSNP